MPAAGALIEEGFPLGINDLMGHRRRRHSDKDAAGVAHRGQHSAGIAVGIGEVAESRMEERVAESPEAVLAVALVQRKHDLIIARFRVE